MTEQSILVVDDEPENLQLMRQILKDHYLLSFAKDGPTALSLARKHKPNLILLDIMMPVMDGYEVCRKLKEDPDLNPIPIIFTTAMNSTEDESLGFDLGGVDYITKPVSPPILLRRIKTQLSLINVEELEKTRLIIIRQLGRAAEFKDNETGHHVIRMSQYSRILAEHVKPAPEWISHIADAAMMHDIGKIGIPDSILLKQGPLNEKEWLIMKRHPKMGADIIGNHKHELLKLAVEIAMTHHEKWDGSGYPRGLAGEDIPLSGRIVAFADVFDALTSSRPYKKAWPMDKAVEHMKKQSASHFDPQLVEYFLESLDEFLEIMDKWKEPE